MAGFNDTWRSGGRGTGAYVLGPRTISEVPLLLKGLAGQTANLFEVRNSGDSLLFAVDPNGNLTIAGTATLLLDETITGNMTVNGNLSVTGTGTFSSSVLMSSSLAVGGVTTFTGNGTFSNNLTVFGQTTLSGMVTVGTFLRLPDGSASAPSLTFTSDSDTGLYRSASNTLAIATNGVNTLTFNNNGTTSTIGMTALTSDVVPNTITIQALSAYSSATVNTTGADLILNAGAGIGVSTTARDGKVHINGFQLRTERLLNWGNTAGSALTTDYGVYMLFTSSGSDSTRRIGLSVNMTGTYSGNEFTQCLGFDNTSDGTSTTYYTDTSVFGYRPGGDRGIFGGSHAVSSGVKVGAVCLAGGSNTENYGVWGAATITRSSGINIGVFGAAANVAGPEFAGAFVLGTRATQPVNRASSAALLADNAELAEDIFAALDGGTDVFVITNPGYWEVTPTATTSGISNYFIFTGPTDTGLTASTEAIGWTWATSTNKTWDAGNIALQREYAFGNPTYTISGGASTITTAATVAIVNAPTAGVGTTITNAYALLLGASMAVQDGTTVTSRYIYGFNTIGGITLTSDLAAINYTITPQNAYSSAVTNVTGASLVLKGGDGVGSTALNDGVVHINGYKQKITYTSDYAPVSSDYSGAALWLDIATSGTTGGYRAGVIVDMKAGYTGIELTQALAFDNQIAGTNADYVSDPTTYSYRLDGNRGIGGYSRAVTTGHNVGVLALASGGDRNYGGWCAATVNKVDAINIGVFGSGLNLSAGSKSVGGFFTLLNSASAPTVAASAGIIASNGGFDADIARFEDGTTTVFIFDAKGNSTAQQIAKTSGVTKFWEWTTAANTGRTASTEVINFNYNATATQTWATGALATQREFVITAPTYAFVGASTISDAGTFVVTNSPIAGTNATITRPWSIWAQAGIACLAGGVQFATTGQSTLNNYTEGTFTPTVTLVGGAGNTVPVYTTNTGRYTRVGNRVFVDVYLTGDGGAEGAGTGQININLPITAGASHPTSYFPCGYALNNVTEDEIWGQVAGSGTTIQLVYFNAINTTTNLTGADQSSTTRSIRIKFSYEV